MGAAQDRFDAPRPAVGAAQDWTTGRTAQPSAAGIILST